MKVISEARHVHLIKALSLSIATQVRKTKSLKHLTDQNKTSLKPTMIQIEDTHLIPVIRICCVFDSSHSTNGDPFCSFAP
jgi:hypothetical protein